MDYFKRNWFLLILALSFAIAAIGHFSKAYCDHCVPTFCGTSSECPHGCYCDHDSWVCRGAR